MRNLNYDIIAVKDKGVYIVSEYKELSRVFSSSFLEKFVKNQHIEDLDDSLIGFKKLRNLIQKDDYRKFYNESYKILSKNYRFEYIYKNEIYMYILKEYNISNDDGILSEVKSGSSIADLVYLNGTSKVFEIKTEIDNNKRLLEQVLSYSQLFKEIIVVTYMENAQKLIDVLPLHVGIMIFVKNGEFNILREPQEFTKNFNKQIMFQTLRRKEYENIILTKFGEIPNVSDAEIYDECFKKFDKLNTNDAHDEMIRQLKLRSNKSLLKRTRKWPKSISFLIENSKLKKVDREKLNELLS